MNQFLKGALIVAAVGAALELGLMCAVLISEKTHRELSNRDAIIVLGARVMPDGELSTTLLHRVQTALKAYQDGYAKLVIVCGGKGRDEPETEAGAMAKWLLANGVPPKAIVMDEKSTDTVENLKNAKTEMLARGLKTAIIVTSDYHLTRALWLAREQGLDAIGAAAPGNDTWGRRIEARFREGLSWINYALGGVLKDLVFWR